MASSKNCVLIKIFGDEEVVQHILSEEENIGKKSRQKPELEYKVNQKKSHYDDDLSKNEVDENFGGTSGEMETNNDPDSLYGNEVFKFKTTKKAGQMALKAQAAASPQLQLGNLPSSHRTSPAHKKMASPAVTRTPSRRSKSGPLTPIPQRLAGPAPWDHPKPEQSTPYRLRRRNEVSYGEGGQESGSEDSLDESSSSDEEDMDTMHKDEGSEVKPAESNLVASAEAYFDIHAMNQVTSDRTLASLDTPRMDLESIRTVLKDVKPTHGRETLALQEGHETLFNRWMLNMCQGWNVLTFGLGSKRSLLEAFRHHHLTPFSHLLVNGYFPSLTIKHILNSITEELLGESKSFTNLFAQIEFIEEYFKKNDEDFYLVVHNIDGVLLRSHKAQQVLSLLAAIRGIHIVASIDHINASFLWDEIQFFRFHWLWYDTPTFLPYQAENSYENSLMVQQSGALALSSLVHVMRSLTPNAKRIFLVLAQYQLEAADRTGYDGMSFQALYQQCREDFLVNSDLTLQAQLVEFKDHRLVRVKKNFEGIEHLLIPMDKSTLKSFLDEHQEAK